jgi:hypothetical protein
MSTSRPVDSVPALQKFLQEAIAVELSTIPAYLSVSERSGSDEPVRDARQERRHGRDGPHVHRRQLLDRDRPHAGHGRSRAAMSVPVRAVPDGETESNASLPPFGTDFLKQALKIEQPSTSRRACASGWPRRGASNARGASAFSPWEMCFSPSGTLRGHRHRNRRGRFQAGRGGGVPERGKHHQASLPARCHAHLGQRGRQEAAHERHRGGRGCLSPPKLGSRPFGRSERCKRLSPRFRCKVSPQILVAQGCTPLCTQPGGALASEGILP